MNKTIKKSRTFRFRRFCRGKFATFQSLHKEVSIGRLANYIADKQLKKSKAVQSFATTAMLVCAPFSISADEPSNEEIAVIPLNEVVVSAVQTQNQSNALHVASTLSAEEIKNLPIQSLNDLLDQLPQTDIRTRGSNGVQADLSINGSTFDQTIVLLNGINFTDTQTGHANLDIPIDLALIDSIEILQNTASSTFGQAFGGAINIITRQKREHSLQAGITGGEHGYVNPYIALNTGKGKWNCTINGSYNKSNGYIDNTDYQYGNIFLNTKYLKSASEKWDFQVGTQLKEFGSNSFYSLKYPDQFECTRTLISSLSWEKFIGNIKIEAHALYRRHFDRFELFREGETVFPEWYTQHNYHVTDIGGAGAKSTYYWPKGKTAIGAELRNEHIFSNVLGDPLDTPKLVPWTNDTTFFTKSKNRVNLNYFIEQSFVLDRFSVAAAVSGNYNNLFNNHFSCSANTSYRIKNCMLLCSFSHTFRLPTFTDLYYESATQIANHQLKPEKSTTCNIGFNYKKKTLGINANIYYRRGKDIIDWIKSPEEEKWHSMNHTKVDALGGDVTLSYLKNGNVIRNIVVSYAFRTMEKGNDNFLSKYALDYLKHKLTLRTDIHIYKKLGTCWSFLLQKRNGSYIDRDNNIQNYSAIFMLTPKLYWKDKNFCLYAECSNLLNQRYYDFGGVEQPRRWLKAGANININMKKKKQ